MKIKTAPAILKIMFLIIVSSIVMAIREVPNKINMNPNKPFMYLNVEPPSLENLFGERCNCLNNNFCII